MVASSGQHFGANVQPTTRKLAKIVKALRFLTELQYLQRRATIASLSEPDEAVAVKLFRKISQAAKIFSINVESTWQEDDLVALKDRFEKCIQSIITRERDRRICEWKLRLRQSFDIHRHGGAAFEWLKSTITPPIVAVKNEVGDIVTDPTEVIAVLQSSWQNLFNKDKLAPLSAFTNQYGDLLQPSKCELPKITGHHLREKLCAAKNTRATALDGWRIPELKALPISFFDLVAQLFNLVEEGAPWPDLCCQAVISTIPKVANSEPADQPGGQQIAGEALNNRPITNLSPLYCAYSGARFKHMASWRESWMDPSMHGARQGHEVFDTSWNLALQLEHAAVTNQHAAGISLDRKKFFDLLEYDIGHSAMIMLGACPKVVRAATSLYSQMNCRYKINGSISSACTRKNGFAQGDSYSLQIALAMMNVWTKHIQKCSPGLSTGSFVDDSHFLSIGTDPTEVATNVASAWQQSLKFDQATGMVTNIHKTFAFANSICLQSEVQHVFENSEPSVSLSFTQSFKLVGSVVTCRGKPSLTSREQRVQATVKKLRKIATIPLRFEHKVKMARAIFTTATFGTELVGLCEQDHEDLRSAMKQVLWKNTTWYRSYAITYTHIVPGFCLLGKPAAIYHCLSVARRILQKRTELRQIFQAMWQAGTTSTGPLARISQCVQELAAHWTSPFVIHTAEGSTLDFLQNDAKAFQHLLRSAIRAMIIRNDKPIHTRNDMIGGPNFLYNANALLIRQEFNKPSPVILPVLSLFELATLRSLLTGVTRTKERLFKSSKVSSPICPHCDLGITETLEHLFWECPAWSSLRVDFLNKWSKFVAGSPPCTRHTGLLTQEALDDGVFVSFPQACEFIILLQHLFIQILQKRDCELKQSQSFSHHNLQVEEQTESVDAELPNQNITHTTSNGQSSDPQDLFPTYPWTYEQTVAGSTFFRAPIPDTWRRYSKGGEWLFGLTCFQPLHWYWSTITWNNDPGADQQVSWLELALDFHASTHCALLRPEQDPATQTAFTMALFFEGASKRLGKICQQTVFPGEAVEHVNALTALGFGRASGLTKRPCLHQPEYVHKVLGEIALTRAKGALKFRQLKLTCPRHPSSSMCPST